MTSMLDDYITHIETHKDSFLARIYGIYTIQTQYFKDVDLIIMQNGARLRNKVLMMYQFDLKGSTVNRYTPFSVANYLNNNEAWSENIQKLEDSKKIDFDRNSYLMSRGNSKR